MTQTQGEPHILVAVDLPLTKAVYGRLDGAPIILAQHPSLLPRLALSMGGFRRSAWAQEGDIWALSLDAHVLEGSQRLTELYAIEEAINTARKRFELPEGAPVVAAVVGNEAMLRASLELQEAHASLLFNRLLLDEMILEGRAASFLGAVLEDIAGIDLRYLAETVRGLSPPPRANGYGELIDEARRSIGSLQPTTKVRGESRLTLRVPATPQLHVGTDGQWTRLEPAAAGTEPGSATSRAIEAFRDARSREGRRLRGVLINVLAEDLSLHSPADPPYITWSERSEAREADLEAILLDARVGIVCPAKPGDGLMPVYGV